VQTIAEQHAAIADMLPKVFTAKAGQPITWKMMGGQHTISFGVPPYFPPVQFLKDGTVRLNPELAPPRGGAPTPPAAVLNDESNNGGAGGVVKIDGGTYSGNGFWSSGFIGSDPYIEYTLRIAKPGRYRYACLLHPSMVGTVVITP
jgi:plastocyanin